MFRSAFVYFIRFIFFLLIFGDITTSLKLYGQDPVLSDDGRFYDRSTPGDLNPENFDEEKYLNRLKLANQSRLENTALKGNFDQSLFIRPRGSSYDGKYVLFESREYGEKFKIKFILFLNDEKRRVIYSCPALEKREEFIKHHFRIYHIVEGNLISVPYDPVGVFKPLHSNYPLKIETVRDKHNNPFLKIYWQKKRDKVLLANYPLPTLGIRNIQVNKIFQFSNYKGISIKFSYVKDEVDNKSHYVEDILTFHPDYGLKEQQQTLFSKNEYELTEAQKKLRYLSDELYDFLGFKKAYKHYYLSGLTQNQNIK